MNSNVSHLQVSSELISVPKWLPMAAMHPVDYYSTFTKNCSGAFTEEEIKGIRAFYYAMCAEADAMLGQLAAAVASRTGFTQHDTESESALLSILYLCTAHAQSI